MGILALRIVRAAAQILVNSAFQIKLLELLLELAAVFHRNFLPHSRLEVEPMAGIEPATDGLRNRCSTTELHWQNVILKLIHYAPNSSYFGRVKVSGKLIRRSLEICVLEMAKLRLPYFPKMAS